MGKELNLSDLKPNAKNPRKIKDKKLKQLKKALDEFGDLSGIVFNRRTNALISGHQRQKVLPLNSQIHVEYEHNPPSSTGTVAEGYISIGDDNFAYREVDWDETKEKAAIIAANKGAGEWDIDKLEDVFKDLQIADFDLDLTMFQEKEFDKWLSTGKAIEEGSGEFEGVVKRILLRYNEKDFGIVYAMSQQALEDLDCLDISSLFKRLLEKFYNEQRLSPQKIGIIQGCQGV